MAQDTLVLQIPDLQRSWIKKLSCFTVLKPTERSYVSPDTPCHICQTLRSGFFVHMANSGDGSRVIYTRKHVIIVQISLIFTLWQRCLDRSSRAEIQPGFLSYQAETHCHQGQWAPRKKSCQPGGQKTALEDWVWTPLPCGMDTFPAHFTLYIGHCERRTILIPIMFPNWNILKF